MEETAWHTDSLAPTTPFPIGLNVSKAEGVFIYTKDGKRYFDLISGVAVSNLGHGNPSIKQALHHQIEQHLHVMVYGEFEQDALRKMSDELLELMPSSLNCIYPVNSGTEANEAAIKLVKRVTKRSGLIALKGAYHGSTHGSLSISGNEVKKYAFRPLLPDVEFIRLNQAADLQMITERTAGVFVELIQGDAGVRVANLCYVHQLAQRCKEVGALLVVDEIQTGFGRTGKCFAFEHYGIVPDVVTLGKALGGGLPIGALVSNRAHLALFAQNPMLGHITTFGGSPMPAAAAATFLSELKKPEILDHVERKGALFEQLLQHKIVKEIRRKGMMFAIELGDFNLTKTVVDYGLEHGFIGFWFISCNTAFRIAPPLTMSEQEIKEACALIQQAFNYALTKNEQE